MALAIPKKVMNQVPRGTGYPLHHQTSQKYKKFAQELRASLTLHDTALTIPILFVLKAGIGNMVCIVGDTQYTEYCVSIDKSW